MLQFKKKADELQQTLQSLLVHVLHVHICKTVSKTTDCGPGDQSHMQFSSQRTNVVKLTFAMFVTPKHQQQQQQQQSLISE